MTSALRLSFWCSCIVTTVLFLIPADYLAPQITDWWDKAQHALMFLLVGLIGVSGYPLIKGRLAAGLVLYGGVVEIVQSATGWRHGDLFDWLANIVGIVASLACARLIVFLRTRRLLGTPPIR